MHFDGLIFDLDGTLWDCSQASADACNRAYEKFGISSRVTKGFVESISGSPSSECEELLLGDIPIELRKEVARSFDEFEVAAIRAYAPRALYPDVETGLGKLRQLYKLFVVSNCNERYLELFHTYTTIGKLFADSECFGRTKRLKYENIRSLMERQRLSSACYIGDTARDQEAAEKAQIPFFHASYGFGKASQNSLAFASFKELESYFTKRAH